ncbi:putative ribosome production factor 1 [Pseudolycoriella hygida]|uniref:Ribosome production factor 1 n=1 Tax=Pseudolycoriella hygida TaxID=35572 RepID=A0A9Q0S9Y1_9DIPT|nr:putative ribosome production factor 1 [Pseudolycoriella hygida]
MASDSSDSEVENTSRSKRNLKRKRDESSDNESNDEDNEGSEVNTPKFRINPMNVIKNKEIRKKLYKKQQQQKKKEQKRARRQRKEEGGPRSTGHTIESLREKDHTTVDNLEDSDQEELQLELQTDEFSEYFNREITPKVLITYADNPLTKTRKFGIELARIIPNSWAKIRNRSSIKKMVKSATKENFTDVIIINENNHEPNGMLVIHLPNGPTAHFKLSNVKITKEIKRSHEEFTKHRPEVILTNFSTRLGLTIGRMLGSLFHHDPEFKGRRAVTFHNQRDYIFFRHHRYQFTKEGTRAKLRELGPRFTLKLRSLQEGTFDSKCGDFDWMITNKRHAMEGRRRFFL